MMMIIEGWGIMILSRSSDGGRGDSLCIGISMCLKSLVIILDYDEQHHRVLGVSYASHHLHLGSPGS